MVSRISKRNHYIHYLRLHRSVLPQQVYNRTFLGQEELRTFIEVNGINYCRSSSEKRAIINPYFYKSTVMWRNTFPHPGPDSTLVIPRSPVQTSEDRHDALIHLGEEGVAIPPMWFWNDLWTRSILLTRDNPSLRNFDH